MYILGFTGSLSMFASFRCALLICQGSLDFHPYFHHLEVVWLCTINIAGITVFSSLFHHLDCLGLLLI